MQRYRCGLRYWHTCIHTQKNNTREEAAEFIFDVHLRLYCNNTSACWYICTRTHAHIHTHACTRTHPHGNWNESKTLDVQSALNTWHEIWLETKRKERRSLFLLPSNLLKIQIFKCTRTRMHFPHIRHTLLHGAHAAAPPPHVHASRQEPEC